MPSLEQRPGGWFRVAFRYGGKKYHHSLNTQDRGEAEALTARLQANLCDLKNGRKVVPDGADLALFLLSDGQLLKKQDAPRPITLDALFHRYREAHERTLESNTLATLKIHKDHLERTFGKRFSVQTLTHAQLQGHVQRRSRQFGPRGKTISPTTIKKEIASFSSLWTWAQRVGLVQGLFPNVGLIYPKLSEKPPFQTWEEIERRIDLEHPTEAEERELWSCLYLTKSEVKELLDFVQAKARQPWIYPMFCLSAHTGARRSEILRSQVADLSLSSQAIMIREKKRDRSKRTTRWVPLSTRLTDAMTCWIESQPGGRLTFCQPGTTSDDRGTQKKATPITIDVSNDHFRRTLSGSKWSVVRGWHVFRHSFASNLASDGVDQRLIDTWMGHQTDEMRKRYRHLLPDQQVRTLQSVFG